MMVTKRLSLALAVAFGLFLAAEAEARTFSMVGQWREWCCTKLQAQVGSATTITASGNYTPFPAGGSIGSQPPGGPDGGLRGNGVVSATGSNPATLTLPEGVIGGMTYSSLDPYNGLTFWYLRSSQNWRNAAATFAPGGGPGNFNMCHGGKACTTPGGGASPTTYNWRAQVVEGPNKFGGSMRQLGFHGGLAKFHLQGANLSINNKLFFGFDPAFKGGGFGGGTLVNHNIASTTTGGSPGTTTRTNPASSGWPLPNMNAASSGAGPPCNFDPNGGGTHTVNSFGQYCTGGTAVPFFHSPGSGSTINFTNVATAWPWTTGRAVVSATQVTAPFNYMKATLTGYDNRTALGKGNIQLVSPFVFVNITPPTSSFPRMMRLRLRLGQDAPTPALSAGGFAVGATVMMLLAVAFVARRRR